MSDSWEIYECAVDDERALIAVDLGFYDAGPDRERPLTVRVIVPVLEPRDDGLPSSEELRQLHAIEDLLTTEFLKMDAVHVGRVTAGGAVRHYFYARREADADIVADRCPLLVTDREIGVDVAEDPAWTQYFGFLYPNALGWQYIQDRRVLETLRENGDTLETPRQIDHAAYFGSTGDRDAFRAAVAARGYAIDGAHDAEDAEMPYGLSFSHVLAPRDIFPVTIELYRLAEAHSGVYDGWGCPVVG